MFRECFIPHYRVKPQDTVGFLLQQAGRSTIPGRDQQLLLARLIQAGQAPDATPGQVRAGTRARQRLVSGNARLGISIAKQYAKRLHGGALSFEDLCQEAMIGLDIAARRYNPELGYSFTTYATHWCKQSVARAIQLQNTTIRQPTTALDLQRRWRYREEGQTLAEFCDRWGYTPERVLKELALAHRAACTSLDAPRRGDDSEDGSSLLDLLSAPVGMDPQLHADLTEAVERLRDRDADSLALVELNELEGHQQRDLGELLGLPRSSAGDQIRKARRRLAALAGEDVRQLLVAA